MRRIRRLVPLALVVVLGGCSSRPGDGGAAPTTGGRDSTTTTAVASTPAPPPPDAALRLDLRGLGPVRVGMTVEEAGAALGRPLQPVISPPGGECAMYGPASGLDGVSFLVADGVVARADVVAGTTPTAAGVAIGQTEAEAQRRYGGRLVVSPHDFHIGGHYLTLVPSAPGDAGFRLVVETDGTSVTAMRAGRLPEVEFVEGCA